MSRLTPLAVLALGLAACGGGGGGGTPSTYTLTVAKAGTGTGTVTGGGINCGTTCSVSLASGTAVTLTAVPDAGSTFTSWTGCDSATGATCNVTMNAARSVTAAFTLQPVLYTLTVAKAGTGTGTVSGGGISCGTTCSVSLASGTAVTLTAVPDAGSTFTSWTGCDTATGATCDVTMNAARSVTATFQPSPGSLLVVNSTAYIITELYVSPAGAGTWGPDQLATQIDPAGTFTLTNLPVGTYDFRAVASAGTPSWQTSSVAITAGSQSTWTLLPPDVGSLAVTNGTGYTIAELYVSPAGANTWGPDKLATQIAPAATFTLTGVPVGTYDFRAVASDGVAYWQTSAVTITAGALVTWTLLPPDVGSLAVANQHCIALDQLYLRPTSSAAWSPNQLAAPVDPGSTSTLAGLPVGSYDLSAVALDGSTWSTYGIAVTAGGTSTWSAFMPAGTGCLTLVNDTDTTLNPNTIMFLFDPFSPSGCTGNNWGTEQLAGATIPPGTSFTLSNIPQGTHDLWARGVTSSLEYVDHKVCGMGIPAGGTFTWYLIFRG